MEQVATKIKRWGNSLGLLLPKRFVEKEHLKEGIEVNVTISQKKTTTVGELIELAKKHPLPKIKKTTQEIMREIDHELYGIKRE